jgi:sialic acid synthase SpsE
MLGQPIIKPTASEKETKQALQKCLVSISDLKKGHAITRQNIISKRTGGRGIPASEVYQAIGLTLRYDMAANQPIHWKDLDA